ncbi:MAG: aminodeoxychorismate synthase, component I [Elusimicrobia bacterium RIFOXYA2_FULL_40_6]|nr:MAG: aminodeoxychorismate synthase, component I [Elusimicrobia bacterium RIFOXYA2_FULL_40_6]
MIIKKISTKLTAIELFDTLKKENNAVFLDSSDPYSKFSRYSLIFVDPFLKFSSKKKDAFTKLGSLAAKYIIPGQKYGFPLGAAAGYITYEAALEFGFYDCVIVFDHFINETYLVSTGLPETGKNRTKTRARNRLSYFLDKINSIKTLKDQDDVPVLKQKSNIISNFTKSQYFEAINKIKGYIEQGDVYQVNLSQQFSRKSVTDAFSLYKAIRQKNKVPFGSYIKSRKNEILSFSMERFINIRGNHVETRPIKGTIPRGKTPREDRKLAKELLSSKKNLAELLMITDLERNDLGRVCDYGSVYVEKLRELEKYATVFHLVSTIKGILHKNKNHFDCIKACFPGGSITGTPKIRSMEIIKELEKTKRNVYCGAIGYFGFNNVTDFNIAIRTIYTDKGKMFFNAGGGITYDSDPKQEYEETLHKVKTFLEVL